ncbi:MAG: anthranilate phosphoribosyltransferase [Deltaproteobacteria bacterium]|nr:anthranilate phosphoribosyltransferase [Deltaproteobacteria bacterium]
MFQKHLSQIYERNDLTESEMAEMMGLIFSGNLADSQIGAFMAALATKGETFSELAGAARAMRKMAQKIEVSSTQIVDTCGTGGDASSTFNISTTTAFVVAGCGVTVAKHGNRSISSKCGSADVLETLGVKLDVDPEVVEEAISDIGIGFLFAPLYHSAMRHAASARREIGLRSIFNMLGPLTNPAAANCQLVGVYAPHLTEMFANALKLLGAKRAMVVHGHDGLDEISVCAPTRVCEYDGQKILTYDITPERFFGKCAFPDDIRGGSAQENALITKSILNGDKGPCRDIVLINAAGALKVAQKVDDMGSGIELAAEAIDSGTAAEKLDALIRFTQENG